MTTDPVGMAAVGEHEHWTAAAARAACFDRQGGLCVACGERLGQREDNWHTHHRLRRGLMPAGCEWCPCNLVALHGVPCHNQGPGSVHGNPVEAHGRGLVLHWPEDPRVVPVPEVFYRGWGWSLLGCDATVRMA